MTTVFHAWPYGRVIDIQSNFRRNKLYRTNQGNNLLGDTFSNRDNIRPPIQFWRGDQPQQLRRWCFLKSRPIHFHSNSTGVIRPWNKTSWIFRALKWTSHFLPQSICLVDQIQTQKPILVVATNQMLDHT